MIKKLRKKFIVTAFLAVFALLFAILFTINMVNFSLVTSQADKITEMIATRTGNFVEPPKNAPNDKPQGGGFDRDFGNRQFGPSSPETSESVRYFTAKITADGNVEVVDYRISIVTKEEAAEWAKSLQNKKVGWDRISYRFRVIDNGREKTVIVIDQSRELGPSFRVLWASLIGGGAGLLLTFLILLPISKVVSKPIEDSDRKQRRFISDAAFELKTPLTVIDANRRAIELADGEREETKSIGKEVSYLVDFTKKLDTLVQLENEPGKENFKLFSLSSLATEIAAPYVDLFNKKGKKLILDVQENVTVSGDVMKMGELIGTCLENGMNYADSYLVFTVKSNAGRTDIEFVNDAENVPDGPLDSVFEKFYRSQEVKESGIEGAGIGLSIAKEVVDIHGGRIMAKGEEKKFILKIEL